MMTSLCVVAEGFTKQASPESVIHTVSSTTGISFQRVAVAALNTLWRKDNDSKTAWILPLESFQDEQRCLHVLHSRARAACVPVEEQHEVKLSLISLCLIPTPVSWITPASTGSSPDYSLKQLFSESGQNLVSDDADYEEDAEHDHWSDEGPYAMGTTHWEDEQEEFGCSSYPADLDLYEGNVEETFLGSCPRSGFAEEDPINMYDLLGSVKWVKVAMSDTQGKLMQNEETREYITEKFKAQGLKAVVMTDNQGNVSVRAFTDADLVEAGVIVRTSVIDHAFQMSRKSADVLGLPAWHILSRTLTDRHQGMLLLSPLATNRLTITATDNNLDDVVQEVERFVEKNTVHTEVVRLSTSRHKFFVTFFLQKVKAINKELEAHRVNIDIVWKKRIGEVLVKGTKQGLVLAREKLTELEAKIVCHTYKEKDRLRVKVLTSSDKSYEADLHNACKESRCMYSFEQEEPGLEVVDGETAPEGAAARLPEEGLNVFAFAGDKGSCFDPKISPADTERTIKVSVVQGDLAEQKVDVIVNTTTPELSLRSGAVSSALLKRGGPKLQSECNSKHPDGVKAGDIASTKGHGLDCKMVYHTTLRHWSPTKGVKLIEEVTKKCLTKANKKQYTSIAFPALGTGLLAYPCDVVAETIFRVVKQFGRDVPSTTVREVRIVIYYTDMQIFQEFQAAENKFHEKQAVPATTSKLASGFSQPTLTNRVRQFTSVRQTTPVTQFTSVTQFTPVPGEIQLFLYTENKNRTSCAQDFVEKLDKAAIKLMVSEERSYDYETLTALSRDEEQEIIKIGEQHDVKIHLKTRLGRLVATGLKMDVTQVFADKRLSDVFDVVAKRLHEQQLSKELEMCKPPDWWAAHKPSEHVKLVRLDPNSTEFQAVEDRFTGTTGQPHAGFYGMALRSPPKIHSIDRVQNPTLYRLYTTKKIHMDKQNRGVQNEKILWHGTQDSNVQNINLNGFNRGYCGRNATSYGEGVYFAVDASYSTQQTYSPPDPQGLRYVYQSKVLVGHCTQGKARMKVPPSRDGPILYDSLVDNPRRPSIYVIFNDTQAYPEYLITFQ